ncbi:MAG: hypothetical protein JSS83_03830 [Cyanobacteria bacterium SZAS LIN-3]|nr:hypothetical protein [Cyanobacteria bacterium SZAS LIN-3]
MFNATRNARPAVLAMATMALSALPVFAAETTVSESTTRQAGGVEVTTTSVTTISTKAPMMVVTNTSGQSTTVPAVFPILLKRYVASNGVTIYYPCAREDASIRRDDLLARIISERAAGKLDSSEADSFIARLQAIEAKRPKDSEFAETREYFRRALDIYCDYDKLAQDMQTESHQGNKQLAASYEYKIF